MPRLMSVALTEQAVIGCDHDTEVTRIEWRYLEGGAA